MSRGEPRKIENKKNSVYSFPAGFGRLSENLEEVVNNNINKIIQELEKAARVGVDVSNKIKELKNSARELFTDFFDSEVQAGRLAKQGSFSESGEIATPGLDFLVNNILSYLYQKLDKIEKDVGSGRYKTTKQTREEEVVALEKSKKAQISLDKLLAQGTKIYGETPLLLKELFDVDGYGVHIRKEDFRNRLSEQISNLLEVKKIPDLTGHVKDKNTAGGEVLALIGSVEIDGQKFEANSLSDYPKFKNTLIQKIEAGLSETTEKINGTIKESTYQRHLENTINEIVESIIERSKKSGVPFMRMAIGKPGAQLNAVARNRFKESIKKELKAKGVRDVDLEGSVEQVFAKISGLYHTSPQPEVVNSQGGGYTGNMKKPGESHAPVTSKKEEKTTKDIGLKIAEAADAIIKKDKESILRLLRTGEFSRDEIIEKVEAGKDIRQNFIAELSEGTGLSKEEIEKSAMFDVQFDRAKSELRKYTKEVSLGSAIVSKPVKHDIIDADFEEIKVEGGVVYLRGLVVEKLKVGSPEKRTGITLFDEATGEPYCISIKNGEAKTTAGECPVIRPQEPESIPEPEVTLEPIIPDSPPEEPSPEPQSEPENPPAENPPEGGGEQAPL
jgi:hypothetical protein